MRTSIAKFLLALAAACALSGSLRAAPLGPEALAAQALALAPQLKNSPFGEPLLLTSQERSGHIAGEVHALLPFPFERVAAALDEPQHWCDILMLHLNTKSCQVQAHGPDPRLALRVGRKELSDPGRGSALILHWHAPVRDSRYLAVHMDTPQGPFGTGDYELSAEAVPQDAGHTWVRMDYGLSYGGAGKAAMQMYLATIGRDKVGFSQERAADGGLRYVGGLRGVVERNTMRYFLALRAYLDTLSLPPAQQQQARLEAWFDATEKYPRQLHEVTRSEYLRTKREELARAANR